VVIQHLCFLRAAAHGPYTVKLRKQSVPVKRGKVVVAHKAAYFGDVQLGFPAQNFSMVFDTGSGHVILPSVSCNSTTCRKHQRYNSSVSTSGKEVQFDGSAASVTDSRDSTTIHFGTGEITGDFVSEFVCIGSQERSNSQKVPVGLQAADGGSGCVQLQVVAATKMTADPFKSFKFDGVLGLGPQGLALAPEFSFLNMMFGEAEIRRPYFSVFLAHGDNQQSEITFGSDTDHFPGKVDWTPAENPEYGYWQLKIDAVRIGDQLLDICGAGDCRAIVDTGTSVLAVPRTHLIDFQKELTRRAPNNRTDIDCRGSPGSPIHFDISGFTISLTPEDYALPAPLVAKADLIKRLRKGGGASSSNGSQVEKASFCRPSLMPIDMQAPMSPRTFIFGEPILRKYTSVFDWKTPRIGFVAAEQAINV